MAPASTSSTRGGVALSWKLSGEAAFTVGYRFVHLSNFSIFHDRHPGISVHTLALAVEWLR